jgi:6-pyruvoyltetrahydropterin/6-carboxytetrahydropterin synthase
MSLTRLARRKNFQCMHRYKNAKWDDQHNQAEFGACFTPHGHGHNYELEVYFEGEVNRETGMIVNLVEVDQLLTAVVAPLEGKHLNFEVPDFKGRVPTTEWLAQWLTDKMMKEFRLPGVRLVKVRLYEYEDLWVDIWP